MRIVVYGWEFCKGIREELEAADIPYVFRDIGKNEVARRHVMDVQDDWPPAVLVEIEANNGNSVVVGDYRETKEALDILKFIVQEC